MRKNRLLALVCWCVLALCLAAKANATIVFAPLGSDRYAERIGKSALTTDDEVRGQMQFVRDSQAQKSVLIDQGIGLSVESAAAPPISPSPDAAAISARYIPENQLKIGKVGEGPDVGLLRYRMNVGGSFTAATTTEPDENLKLNGFYVIQGRIGFNEGKVRHNFQERYRVPEEFPYHQVWRQRERAGAFLVRPGDDVNPDFRIGAYRLDSSVQAGPRKSGNISTNWSRGEISMELADIPKASPFRWSYDPLGKAGQIRVFGSYRFGEAPVDLSDVANVEAMKTDDGKTKFKLDGTKKVEGIVPRVRGEAPSDYKIVYELGNPFAGETTLAFLLGEPGSYEKISIASMTEIYMGVGLEFLVPMLFDVNEVDQLFVGIDLTQFLAFTPQFRAGEAFEFVNGRNGSLPGVFVGLSHTVFSETEGLVSDVSFSGTAFVGGIIDGSTVAEPSVLALMALGIGGIGYSRHRRRRTSSRYLALAD